MSDQTPPVTKSESRYIAWTCPACGVRNGCEHLPGRGDSFIVSHFGLDGLRDHFMPGNRRKGTSPRAKRAFDSPEEAQRFLAERGWYENSIYQCSVCGKYHTASPPRHGESTNPPQPGSSSS